MRTRGTLRLATRGSDLARRQAESVAEALSDRRYDVELVEVETTGDRVRDELIHRLGRTGAFVRALDERVLEGDADAAVHSMKDMPTALPEALSVAGVPERAPAGDLLVTPDGTSLADLPRGATVGTGSLRRRAQLLARRPDLAVEGLRGNVDTRVEKLLAPGLQREHERRLDAEEAEADPEDEPRETFEESVDDWFASLSEFQRGAMERRVETEYDAIVLAEAGLRRAGLLRHVGYERLPRASFVPAAGQGAVAVTAASEEATEAVRDAVDHPVTRVATTVERTVLATLGGGCIAPIGVHARLQGEYVGVRAQVFDADGEECVEGTRDLPVREHADAAVAFAEDLRERGAAELVAAARDAADGANGAREEPGDGDGDGTHDAGEGDDA
jgi:hydroxymethylbilane synthase